MDLSQRRSRNRLAGAALALPFLLQLWFALTQPRAATFGEPALLFVVVVVAATLCVVTAALVLWRAFSTETPELAWLGLYFMSVSLLPLVHGLTTPGILYGDNSAFMVSAIVSIPLGVCAGSPALFGRHSRIARSWRAWTAAWLVILATISVSFLAAPSFAAVPNLHSPIGAIVTALTVGLSLLLGFRHVRLATIAQNKGPLIVAAGYSLTAGSFAAFLGSEAYSLGFWVAHGLDISGVCAATIGAYYVYKQSRTMTAVLSPIVAIEPIAALEIGLHPRVIEFVADLDTKDPMTRDHVVRTCELAIGVAEAMKLAHNAQRDAGLVGLLHDIGKLEIPDSILTKPGSLTDDELAIMRTHAAMGAALIEDHEVLRSLAPSVRSHHERFDGGGYPDGLARTAIPIAARIVSACDAYDAMTHSRHYREAMRFDDVVTILEHNAGTQWDPDVVEALIGIVKHNPTSEPRLLSSVRYEHHDCVPEGLQPSPS